MNQNGGPSRPLVRGTPPWAQDNQRIDVNLIQCCHGSIANWQWYSITHGVVSS